jgi:hypothetical protein
VRRIDVTEQEGESGNMIASVKVIRPIVEPFKINAWNDGNDDEDDNKDNGNGDSSDDDADEFDINAAASSKRSSVLLKGAKEEGGGGTNGLGLGLSGWEYTTAGAAVELEAYPKIVCVPKPLQASKVRFI